MHPGYVVSSLLSLSITEFNNIGQYTEFFLLNYANMDANEGYETWEKILRGQQQPGQAVTWRPSRSEHGDS